MEKLLFTSESVTEGHPDKMCDQISDAILDALTRTLPIAGASPVDCSVFSVTYFVVAMALEQQPHRHAG